MKKIFAFLLVAIIIFSCNDNRKDKAEAIADNRVSLVKDTLNTVKLTDTLVIYESTCRGCAYESSTDFGIVDSMNIIKLEDIVTTDNSPADMDGGSISKDLILVPQKTGTTVIKLYKFWKLDKTAADSANFVSYKIEVK